MNKPSLIRVTFSHSKSTKFDQVFFIDVNEVADFKGSIFQERQEIAAAVAQNLHNHMQEKKNTPHTIITLFHAAPNSVNPKNVKQTPTNLYGAKTTVTNIFLSYNFENAYEIMKDYDRVYTVIKKSNGKHITLYN